MSENGPDNSLCSSEMGGGRKCPTKKVVLVLEPETCVEVTEEVERH